MLEAELDADSAAGEKLAGELRECAAEESRVHARLKERGEEVTRGEVRAQRARDHAQDAEAELTALAEQARARARAVRRSRSPDDERAHAAHAASSACSAAASSSARSTRSRRQEYKEALEHVEELERQREDLETALRELAAA